jgi:uncharacterized surface anchored protein
MTVKSTGISILFLAASAIHAQEVRSVIFGRVLDPAQAAVAGAAVHVTNTGTNVSTSLSTNDTGYYEADFLVAGSYQVRVEAPGFKQALRERGGDPGAADDDGSGNERPSSTG